jgi:hypothetical protein
MIIFCDLDGTFINHSHRIHLIEGENRKDPKNWDVFYSDEMVLKNPPIPEGVAGLKRLWNAPYTKLHLLTGRPERTRAATMAWMKIHLWSNFAAPLYMRRDGDLRPATVYKMEQVRQVAQLYRDQALLFVDDDERNFPLYQHHGLVLKAPECWGSLR